MSRIVVVGGHGRTGLLVVKALVAAGDNVVATIRNPKHTPAVAKAGAEVVVLDLEKSTGPDFGKVFKGADAVVFAAGSAEGESSTIDRTGTIKTVRAAETAGVPRYVTISALGDSIPLKGVKLSDEMKDYYKQKRAGSKRLRASSLDWTILEPGELTDGQPTGKIALSETGLVDSGTAIDRADVAAAVVAVLKTPGTGHKIFQLVSGNTAIAAAVKKAAKG